MTPSRIAIARKRRGFTHVQLAEAVGVSSQSLSNYENGRQTPQWDVLERIADALQFPVDFFTGDEVDLIDPASVAFRARKRMRARERNMALSAAELVVELHDWLETQLRMPAPDLPTLDKPTPADAAAMVRSRWGLGLAPISNMVQLLESRGVRVFSLGRDYDSVDAFSFYRGTVPFVFLSTGKTPERSRFDAAHELGHLVLHSEGASCRPNAEEEANTFARHFLMPPDSVSAHMPHSPFLDQILHGKKIWNVSALALTYHLHDLSMLTDWHYRQALIELGKRGYKTSEPDGMKEREKSLLLEKVFSNLRRKGITPRHIMDELNLPSDMLAEYSFGLALVAMNGGATTTQATRTGQLRLA